MKNPIIIAVPELLNMLDVSGCIITADAMSCQKVITEKITEKEADYVLGLKENHPAFCKEVEEYFDATQKEPQNYSDIKSKQTIDFGHGHIETRTYYLTTEINWYEGKDAWSKLHTRYFISSLEYISEFAEAVLKHWGIKNSLPWCLDMTFREDYSRIRKDHSAENMVVVRHIALNIIKKYTAKISLARKRRRCAYDDAFFADAMNSVHA